MERCSHCASEVHRDEICYVGDQPVCRSCAETETLVCSRCGERIWETDNCGDEETVLCSSCYEDHYVRCVRCGRVVPYAAVYYMNEDEDEENPYCEQCYSEYKDVIHCYSYKPTPQFYGEGPLYMGVELEADDGGKSTANARKLLAVFNRDCAYGYIKSDGSLDDGLELVTHPCTLSEHQNKVPWEKVLQKFRALGYMSHQSRTCGLHVHVNRTAFGRTEQQQEEKSAMCCICSSDSGRKCSAFPAAHKVKWNSGPHGMGIRIPRGRFWRMPKDPIRGAIPAST